MKLSPNDPKLTAYALGELPAQEAAEVERQVQGSPELQKAVAEIREMSALLEKEFANEPAAAFSDEEKAALLAQVQQHDKIIALPARNFWRTAGVGAIAAGLLALFAWQFWISKKSEPERNPVSAVEPVANSQGMDVAAVAPGEPVEEKLVAQQDSSEPARQFRQLYSRANEPAVNDLAGKPVELEKTQGAASYNYQSIVPASPTEPMPLAGRLAPAATASQTVTSWGSIAGSSGNFSGELTVPESSSPVAMPVTTRESVLVFQDRRAGKEGYFETRKQPSTVWYSSKEGTAEYPKYAENRFESVRENPLSTFSIDVDTASYANVRRFLKEGRMPPRDAVRIEEMINYFSYDYPQPKGDEPFSVNMEVASCPWESKHRLLRIGLKGKEIARDKRPPSNFVFLVDVSGSMAPRNRLPLIKQSLQMLAKRMTEGDRIAIVVYASQSGVVLESTSAVNKEKILAALDRLKAGGSTNGGQGIQTAYALAEKHFIEGGVNRVILCTDGDFNVGITDQEELIELIQSKAKSGVFLSVLGVGTDNYKDALMQKIADKGNGNYHYIDTLEEAHKVLIQQMNGTLVTIAKDVKIQIEFNPAQVSSYRLIGYEKRMFAAEDFNNDRKDAGEIGAGHTVTALYEIVPAGMESGIARLPVDELKYQKRPARPSAPATLAGNSREMLTLKLRYKKPDGEKSLLREYTLMDQGKKFEQASSDFRFAAAVASFGMILKDSEYKGRANFGSVLEIAREAKGSDAEGYRAEFINLVKKARQASGIHSEE